jgi:predicted ribosome quality control (RQC) complex YloA/Tae2 family protein
LVISARAEASTLYLASGLARAKKNSAGIFLSAVGRRISSIAIRPSDRVVDIELDDGRRISALCFGSSANILLLTPDGIIEAAFRKNRDLAGTQPSFRTEPTVLDLESLRDQGARLDESPVAVQLRRRFPVLGSTMVTEALVRAGVNPSDNGSTLDAERVDAIIASLRQILLEVGTPSPRAYLEQGGSPSIFSIIELRHVRDLDVRRFATVSEGVRFFLTRRKAGAALDGERESLRGQIQGRIDKAQRALKALEQEAREAERAMMYERMGSALMANLVAAVRGENRVVLEDAAGPIEIPLDPKFTRLQNAQHYFDRARRARTSAGMAGERAAGLRATITEGTTLLASLDQCESRDQLRSLMSREQDSFGDFGIGEHGETDPFPFKRFVVDGGFEVWAGKNSQNNDELTLRHAKPNDLWFHARGSSGSHVILRVSTGKGEPGKRAREEAAAIAAYYSKMKGAGLVPVAMTEKRYVRKPKGAKPGSVVIEREKVLMVRPQLPQST